MCRLAGGRRTINQVVPLLSEASSSTLPAPGISPSQHPTPSSSVPREGAKVQTELWANGENCSLDTKD